MLSALTDYVQMIAENKDIKLNKTQIEKIAYAILENEVVWEVIDEHIIQEIEQEVM